MKYNTRTITLTTDVVTDFNPHASQTKSTYNETKTKQRAEALAILVGGEYNKYGRNINADKIKELQQKFEYLVAELISLSKNEN